MPLARLDAEVHRRGLARSREQAKHLIESGHVRVNGVVVRKPASRVDQAAPVLVRAPSEAFVSRGATKLSGALEVFPDINVTGKRALDVGASTGGFTQVLLASGAEHVVALDVGYGQLAWPLRTDPRVTVVERRNIRYVTAADLAYRPDLIVADLSFISLRLVLPVLVELVQPDGDLLVMVKPQFEVGRDRVGSGVVHDPDARVDAVMGVVRCASDLGWGLRGVVASSLPGPRGNVEYFIWLRSGAEVEAAEALVRHAVEEGPE
jgi:23S rRNA (cytidine1920-2'-O)/16S rRNA (cytidine1409-2'-O)-methyltransferase